MSERKVIELTFSNDKSVNCREVNKPDNSYKKLNFDGLIIDVKQPASTRGSVQSKKFDNITSSKNVIQKHDVPEISTSKNPLRSEPDDDHVQPPKNQTQENKQGDIAIAEPEFTEEDWKVFKQFMDPLPPKPLSASVSEPVILVKNRENFVCSICERFITTRQGVILKACLHNFCRDCLIDEITNNHDAMGQVKCPFSVEKCQAFIGDEEVKALLGINYHEFALNIVQRLHDALSTKMKKDEATALLKTDDLDFIENTQEFECKICFCDIEVGEGVTLKSCQHQFCKECLIGLVKNSDEIIVKCPFMGNDGKSCEFTVQEREIRGLVPAEVFEKFLEMSLKEFEAKATDIYHCKTPDCKGFIQVDKSVRGFMCWLCNKVNCIGCKVIHHGKNCQEYQDKVNPNAKHIRENAESEKALKNMVAAGEAMYCPGCGIPVMKVDGCDYVTCSTCKLGICWITRKPRNPLTKSDGTVVDGCHCRENGTRCHPQCTTCH